MLSSLFARFEKVKLASTLVEREAIYRFRYKIYVEELERNIGGVDHTKKMVVDEEDEQQYSFHFYVGTKDKIIGCVRLRVWQPGNIPPKDFQILSMHLFPGIESMVVAESGRLMVERSMRGKLIIPSLMLHTYPFLAADKNVDLLFLYCRPGLVRFYRKLGARPYRGDLVPAPEGLEIPMVGVLSDYQYYKQVGSPIKDLVKEHFGPGKRMPHDLSAFGDIFDEDRQLVASDTREILEGFQREFIQEEEKGLQPSFLDSLPAKAIQDLTDMGFILNIEAGILVTREGHTEKEMFLILNGNFEVFAQDRRIAILEKGDFFGEMAFFQDSGKRSASVRSLTDGRLLVVKGTLLKKLQKSDPEIAYAILFNLGRIMSNRVVSLNSQLF